MKRRIGNWIMLIVMTSYMTLFPYVSLAQETSPLPEAPLETQTEDQELQSEPEPKQEKEKITEQESVEKTLIETLSNDEKLPDRLISNINNFAQQYGYDNRLPDTTATPLEQTFNFLVNELTQNFAPPQKVARFYPNVYLSFMTPYWVIASKILHYI